MGFLSLLWPPYGFYQAKQATFKSSGKGDLWESALEELKIDLPLKSKEDLDAAEKIVSSVLEGESKRKDVLEAKATTFIVTPAVAAAITAAIAPLTKDFGLSSSTSTIVTICYAIALIHLFVSSWYAITARRAEAYIVLSSINARKLLAKTRKERIVMRLAYARLNEPALLMKSNRLSVSEDMFLRGIAFLTVAAFVTLMAHVAGL